MKFITHNQDDLINVNATHGLGQISTTYAQLVSTFGEPLQSGFDDYKCDAEWWVQFDDGTVATIYNWKNGKNYCGDAGTPTELIDLWNIGGYGHESTAVEYVKQALEVA